VALRPSGRMQERANVGGLLIITIDAYTLIAIQENRSRSLVLLFLLLLV
jgi:hypothetical protein